MSEFNPLVQRVDALLKRHQQQATPAAPAGPDTTLDLRAVFDEQPVEPTEALQSVAAAPGYSPVPTTVEEDFPLLTEVVESVAPPGPESRNAALTTLVEAALIEKVLASLDGALDQRLGRTVSELLGQAMDGLRADLSSSMRELVRDAVSAAVREELAARSQRQD